MNSDSTESHQLPQGTNEQPAHIPSPSVKDTCPYLEGSDIQGAAVLAPTSIHTTGELNAEKADGLVQKNNETSEVQPSRITVEGAVKQNDANEPKTVPTTPAECPSQKGEEQNKQEESRDKELTAPDLLFPMRADIMSDDDDVNQSCGANKTHIVKSPEKQVEDSVMPEEGGKATQITDTVEICYSATNPLSATAVHVTLETQSPNEESLPGSENETDGDTDSTHESATENESIDNSSVFIDGVEDPPTMEEKIEKIMPKEDREMYKAVIDCIVTSEDNKKCCSCKDCFSSCCFSVSCAIANPTSICKQGGTKVKNIITETLQKGAQNGWNIFQEIAFPTMRPFFRDLIAISEFLIGLLGLILSLISFSLGNNAGYNIFHIVLAGVATILGLIDTITSLKYSAAFKEAWKKRRTRGCCQRQTPDNIDPNLAADQGEKNVETQKKNYNETQETKETSITKIQNRNEPKWLKKGWDIGRLIIVELIFYPLLICDLIEFIVDKGYRFEAENATDVMGFFLVVHSFASQMFYVYILRLVVLIAMIVHIHKKRTLPQDKKEAAVDLDKETDCFPSKDEEDARLNRNIAADGVKFQSYFAFHVAGQMTAQILMIVAISITIYKENETKTLDDSISISPRLWFMMVAGYVFPFIGILSFFIPTFYWTYEHPNGICINVLSILEAPGIGHVLMFDEDSEDVRTKVVEIAKNLNKDKLKEDFRNLRDQAFSDKLFYPFKSPVLVVVCLAYSFCQFAFVLIAILSIQNGDPGSVFFYVLSVVVGIVANVYVLAVAAFWTTIIVGILLLIAIVIALFVLACILLSCGSSKSSRETRVY